MKVGIDVVDLGKEVAKGCKGSIITRSLVAFLFRPTERFRMNTINKVCLQGD